MSGSDSMRAVAALRVVLRLIGTSSLFALIFVAAPHSWMRDVHEWLGMGELPEGPVVWYLARSTSALYALVGGLFWTISFDIPRYRPVLLYVGAAVAWFGLALLVMDWWEGMPMFWKLWEGPFVIALGLVLLILGRKVRPDTASRA